MQENSPSLWHNSLPFPTRESHKYSRGTAVINGGGSIMTGAARLAAIAALRAGAGLVTITPPTEALPIYATSLLAVMVHPIDTCEDFTAFIQNHRRNALLIGPGNGICERTRTFTLAAVGSKKPCVLDADSLTVFSTTPANLFTSLHPNVILTPHEGEFKRLFSTTENKINDTQKAAQKSGAIILHKGAETIITHPDGRTVINNCAPPWLATAGSGDVLAGIITGLLAQQVNPFDAACMGVWLHSQAALLTGIGMIAEDLPGLLPNVLQKILNRI